MAKKTINAVSLLVDPSVDDDEVLGYKVPEKKVPMTSGDINIL